ncbi:MAG: histidinol phosphate phosphatase domain-containing protein [Candidatus Heimdallarchaeota archaeon]|nr:histidinol phosphate phosphatase domain-containing protein [Candidatus Heimdallarchaeota archaeon]MBY8993077.1 histidinol phosphate phosphatase domain-containing protein [Candidatus Heimdallarchaeota archaeon]
MLIFKEAIENLLANEKIGRCDFHTHSFLTDGVLLPIEQLRRAFIHGHVGYGITDHVSLSTLDVIPKLIEDCKLATKHWGILALPGVEVTHVPVNAIEEVVEKSIEMGALIVVVHGETIAEPVEPGTNLKATQCKDVDILANPGLLTKDVADQCKKNNVFVEITSNRTHSITNGHVAKIGKESQVKFIQNTDTHSPGDMKSYEEGERILIASGFSKKESNVILQDNIREFLSRIYERL